MSDQTEYHVAYWLPPPLVRRHIIGEGACSSQSAAASSLCLLADVRDEADMCQRLGDDQTAGCAEDQDLPSRRLLSTRVSAFLDYLKEAFPMGTPDELAAYIGG
jgi:hypothetical protein